MIETARSGNRIKVDVESPIERLEADTASVATFGAKAGESHARLTALVSAHADLVWRTVRRLGIPPPHTDDVTQEVFVITARKLDVIEQGKENAFLVGVARNVVAHARRSLARRREVLDGEHAGRTVYPGPDPEGTFAEKEARALLDRALDALGDDLRIVLVLHDLEEMTMLEIAQALDIPPGTAASRLRRAREQFMHAAARLLEPKTNGDRR